MLVVLCLGMVLQVIMILAIKLTVLIVIQLHRDPLRLQLMIKAVITVTLIRRLIVIR